MQESTWEQRVEKALVRARERFETQDKEIKNLKRQLDELKTLVNGMASRMREFRKTPFEESILDVVNRAVDEMTEDFDDSH
jgi:hypothetical protein